MAELGPADPVRVEGDSAQRLDLFLAQRLGLARTQAQRLVREGQVEVDGAPATRPSLTLRPGQLVRLREPAGPAAQLSPPPEIHFVYQDEEIAVVDKPAGMVVHPGAGHRDGTLADALRAMGGPWSDLAGEDRPGIVHRLDRGTSGLLVVARTSAAHSDLAEQLKARTMGREYWAIAKGQFREDRGRIEAAIGRDPRSPRRMSIAAGGRDAVTEFSVLERLPEHTILRLRLLTGRTHQIRAHLAYLGRPLEGDDLYGRQTKGGGRPALHAAMLHFRHPGSKTEMTFQSPLPEDLAALRERLGAQPQEPLVWPWGAG